MLRHAGPEVVVSRWDTWAQLPEVGYAMPYRQPFLRALEPAPKNASVLADDYLIQIKVRAGKWRLNLLIDLRQRIWTVQSALHER